ncbi:ABC transporter substrate-binding protein [Pseudonocardia pini]|uniref:ABC transporter substrate-binding protein n=1 Tax=Pseudonocardia pini TaxID=2758030 RepID=UPI0015F044AC|nr:ABC transporter substrate-binding protein [Pseudonocardia pini]
MRVQIGKRRPTAVVVAALVAALGMVLAGCGGSASGGAGGDSTVRWGTKQIQANWDPIVTGSTGATIYLTPIYESLFTVDGERHVVPALASGYEYNAAGDQITITLKPGLTFQDGSPVDAEAVKFNIERIKTQENSALKGSYNNVETATVVDPLTVRLDLGQQDYQIPYLLAVRGGMLPSKTAAQADPGRLNTAAPVGAGPFTVASYDPESKIVLEKWDGYWDAANIKVDRIEINFGVDPSTLTAGLQSGVYNWAQLDPQQADEAEKAGFDVLASVDRHWGIQFLSLNTNKAPFTDPAVVEAVRYAVNPEEYSTKLGFGLAAPAHQPFPEGHPAYVSALNAEHPYDPAKARDILAKAGYADGSVSFDLSGMAIQSGQIAEILQEQLKAVGITANIALLDQANWGKGYYSKSVAASLFGYVGRDSHVQALTEHYDAGGVLNLSSPTTSPEFQEALKAVRATPIDAPDYEAKLQAAAQAGYEHGSTVALYSLASVVAKDESISDPPAIDGYQSWKGVQFTPGTQ